MSKTTKHYDRVKLFMEKAGQETPDEVSIPSAEVRVLRAKLILEEAFETIAAMGIQILDDIAWPLDPEVFTYNASNQVDLQEVADGCADIKVVTTGTLIAFGIKDRVLQEEVDSSNLRKFVGGYRSDGTDGNPEGKWIKPKDWTPPDINKALAQ